MLSNARTSCASATAVEQSTKCAIVHWACFCATAVLKATLGPYTVGMPAGWQTYWGAPLTCVRDRACAGAAHQGDAAAAAGGAARPAAHGHGAAPALLLKTESSHHLPAVGQQLELMDCGFGNGLQNATRVHDRSSLTGAWRLLRSPCQGYSVSTLYCCMPVLNAARAHAQPALSSSTPHHIQPTLET